MSDSQDLRLASVTKRFGRFTAVDDLTLSVPQGSFFALLGPSGCGKTTTLRMVAGLEEPSSGVITLGGQDVTGLRPYRRPVNTVFQSYALFPHLDVAENVAFGLRRRKVGNIRERVAETLELVELTGFEKRRPGQLSGGQQQRVALARALINRPEVLLLDEPLGALDLKLRRAMQLELKRIQTEVGITFLHVTHDQEEAMWMADTVAVMNEGRVEQMGAPADIYEFPSTLFTANFLGQSNLLAGRVVGRNADDILVEVAGGRFAVPAARSRASGETVYLGVRPEKAQMTADSELPPDGHNRLAGLVTDTCYAGVSTEYMVRTRWGQELSVFSSNATSGGPIAAGAEITVHWRAEHSFLLDRDSADAAPEPPSDQAAARTPGSSDASLVTSPEWVEEEAT
ncbi:MAG: ABC transporter ATP-binding protein [Micromonosporaceae bacterium]